MFANSRPYRELLTLLAGRQVEVADWEQLLELAKEERLLLPVWLRIDRALVPTELRNAIETQSTALVLEEMRRGRQLAEIMDLLGQDALAYKGPTLGALAFGSSSQRQSGDLDILVPAKRYRECVELLLADGFTYYQDKIPRCTLKLHYEVTLVHAKRQVTVDLHRSFFSEAMPLELESRTQVQIGGRAVTSLPAEELFILLAVHGCKHCWRELRWVYDLVALQRQCQLDWERVESLANDHLAFRACGVALGLCRELFECDVPPVFEPDRQARELVAESLRYIAGPNPTLHQLHRYQWRTFDKTSQRARFLLITLLRPHELDLEWVDLPKEMWYFYYLIRPLRILWSRLISLKDADHG